MSSLRAKISRRKFVGLASATLTAFVSYCTSFGDVFEKEETDTLYINAQQACSYGYESAYDCDVSLNNEKPTEQYVNRRTAFTKSFFEKLTHFDS